MTQSIFLWWDFWNLLSVILKYPVCYYGPWSPCHAVGLKTSSSCLTETSTQQPPIPLPPPPAASDSLHLNLLPGSWLFGIPHICEIMWCLSFCPGRISLRKVLPVRMLSHTFKESPYIVLSARIKQSPASLLVSQMDFRIQNHWALLPVLLN